jgi:hypothetical protein
MSRFKARMGGHLKVQERVLEQQEEKLEDMFDVLHAFRDTMHIRSIDIGLYLPLDSLKGFRRFFRVSSFWLFSFT